MNSSSTFTRKIIYIALIGALLIPLSLISRPATRDTSEKDGDPGGKLSTLRDDYSLSQSKLMEIDPTSETMKLASLGLRGVAVNMLWMQAIEHKKTENWDQMASTLNALVKIQPNFVKVWEYQAHNLSYNISMEFDDYEYRYHWVKRGIKFLHEGRGYNYLDHRMTDNLGFFTGMKIGRSDEKSQFRRLFREDSKFHDFMENDIAPKDYWEGDDYKYDHWKMAYWWYQKSQTMVEDESAFKYSNDMLFWQKRPAQLRNQATGLQDEYESTQVIQEIWKNAEKEWLAYGSRQLLDAKGLEITIEKLAEEEARLEEARAKLDALVPGARKRLIKEIQQVYQISDDDLRALDIPPDQRTDEEARLVRRINRRLFQLDQNLDMKVASDPSLAKDPARQYEVNRAFNGVMDILSQIQTIDSHIQTTNYRYWRKRTQAEATPEALAAHQALFKANEKRRKSIFDDEYELDPKTGEKKILDEGAITLYNDAFSLWAEVLEMFPDLRDGHMANQLTLRLIEYEEMLNIAGMDWPLDHPLQEFIDRRARQGEPDELPTSESLGLNDEEMEKEMDPSSKDGDQMKKDGDKAEEMKKEEMKKEEMKKEEMKKEEMKKEEMKKEEMKKEEMKKEEMKKEAAEKAETEKADGDPAAAEKSEGAEADKSEGKKAEGEKSPK